MPWPAAIGRSGYLLIAGLVLFYIGFFALMWLRARQLSQALLTPIAGISRMLGEIGLGRWRPEPLQAQIRELDEMSRHTRRSAAAWLQRVRALGAQRRLELVLESATESLWEYDMANHSLRVRGAMVARFAFRPGSSATAISVSASPGRPAPGAGADRGRREGLQQRYEIPLRRQHGRIPLALYRSCDGAALCCRPGRGCGKT